MTIANKRVLLIDHFDSFVHNLADEFSKQHCQVDVYRSHWPLADALAYIQQQAIDLLVLSPGPGKPEDATLSLGLLAQAPANLPILGVCLGHQCIIHYFGGQVSRAKTGVMHGKPALIQHTQQGLFGNLSNPLQVARYHSLVGYNIPATLIVDASCEGEVMAVHHRDRPIYGVQFHPESILTPEGPLLIANFLALCDKLLLNCR